MCQSYVHCLRLFVSSVVSVWLTAGEIQGSAMSDKCRDAEEYMSKTRPSHTFNDFFPYISGNKIVSYHFVNNILIEILFSIDNKLIISYLEIK